MILLYYTFEYLSSKGDFIAPKACYPNPTIISRIVAVSKISNHPEKVLDFEKCTRLPHLKIPLQIFQSYMINHHLAHKFVYAKITLYMHIARRHLHLRIQLIRTYTLSI